MSASIFNRLRRPKQSGPTNEAAAPAPASAVRPAPVAPVAPAPIQYTVSPVARLGEVLFRRNAGAQAGSVATVGSALVHAAALLVIAEVTVPTPPSQVAMEVKSWLMDEELPKDEEIVTPELTLAPIDDDREHDSPLASLATSIASVQSDSITELKPENLSTLDVVDASPIKVPIFENAPIKGNELSLTVVRPGTIGSEVVHVDGAVDRITHEIATRLDSGPVLVIWLMDQSISLADDREQIAARLERVYRELGKLDTGGDSAVLNSVIAYGAGLEEMVKPTGDPEKVVSAIRKVPIDESGLENVFSAVVYGVEHFKPLITVEKRQPMVVVWTDESGDDFLRLEEAVKVCRQYRVPVFTVGPSSMFGQQMGTHAYTHPEDGNVYNLPVCRGPDTPFDERLNLPFWFDGKQYETLHAGMPPYALARLAMETGGAYFINDAKADRSQFDLTAMRPYMPEYISAEEYRRKVARSPMRLAVMSAVETSQKMKVKGTPRLEFAPTGDTYIDELRDAQETAAYNNRTMTSLASAFGRNGFEKEYEAEESPRWKAWYDLTYGRILAMGVRNAEFNWACAEMKGKGSEFVNKESNRWTFKPDKQIKMGSTNERMAEEAERLLKRCIANNPGTPWAVLAQRELDNPFGFRIEESYVAPPPPPMQRPAAAGNPPPPPVGIRQEQLRMLERPKTPNLPKL